MTTKKVIDCFNEFFSRITADNTQKDRLFLAAGLVELMRRAKNPNTVTAMATLVNDLPAVAWNNIDFSVTQTLFGAECKQRVLHAGVDEKDVNEVLLRAFTYFVDAVESFDEKMSLDLFLDLVEGVAVDYLADKCVKPQRHVTEIFNPSLPARCFDAAETFAALFKELRAEVVYFRGELPGGRLGPDTRGIMFESAVEPSWNVILETGEYVRVKRGASNVACVSDIEDFRNVPDTLLLAATVSSVSLFMCGVIDKTQESSLNAGVFGRVTAPQHNVMVSFADLQPLEHVFNQARDCAGVGVCGATGPSGASVRFPVPNTDMAVIIDARTDAHGAYSVSRLVCVNELDEDIVIMRHDMPRLITTRGVYLFPTKENGLVSLTAIF